MWPSLPSRWPCTASIAEQEPDSPCAAARRPTLYFVVSAVFHYLGPAFAVLLFARVEVLGVAWLRIASAALVFALWRRPWRAFAALDRDGRRLLLAWGAVLALMNCCFYLAIDRLPLGTVAAIEFLPVIALAALGARTPRNVVALALAVAGVYLLDRRAARRRAARRRVRVRQRAAVRRLHRARPPRRPARGAERHRRPRRLDADRRRRRHAARRLGGRAGARSTRSPSLAGIGVGISSSVIPYVSDQLAMARLPRATYALMVSLLPATATVIGVVVLPRCRRRPSWPASRW